MILANLKKCYIPCGQKVAKNSTFTKCSAQMVATDYDTAPVTALQKHGLEALSPCKNPS